MTDQPSDDIISFTPAPGWLWTAHFNDDDAGEAWEMPVVGWALVRRRYDDGPDEHNVEPVVIDEEKFPMTLREYCANRHVREGQVAFLTLYRGLSCREPGSATRISPSGLSAEESAVASVAPEEEH